jgi:hypothetical protein
MVADCLLNGELGVRLLCQSLLLGPLCSIFQLLVGHTLFWLRGIAEGRLSRLRRQRRGAAAALVAGG